MVKLNKLVLLVMLVVALLVVQTHQERDVPDEERQAAAEERWRREKTAEDERQGRRRPSPRPEPEPVPFPVPVPEWERERGRGGEEEMFVLRNSKRVVSTDAGEMRVIMSSFSHRGRYAGILERPLHIGFIKMEPRSLFLPQYMDSNMVIFLLRGEARLGLIYKDEYVEKQLRMGDVYTILAGSTFHILNTGETQRLHIICSIDPSESLGFGPFTSFFVGGGANPASVLSGFDPPTLSTAFNVSIGEVQELVTQQRAGPIVYADSTHSPALSAHILKLKEQQKLKHLKTTTLNEGKDKDKEQPKSSWRKALGFFWSNNQDNKKDRDLGDDKGTDAGHNPENLFDRDPDFQNNYGRSIALDKHAYGALGEAGVGVFLVNLTAGSMMAPHINPRASEYAVVVGGSGTIQVVYPNGTSALNTRVDEGDVFWIPRYFPFCQIASRTGPFSFVGFSTSSDRNWPQFLVGTSSILRTMRGPVMATAFGLTEDQYHDLVDAQRESIILPTPSAAPPDERPGTDQEEKGFDKEKFPGSDQDKKGSDKEKVPRLVRSLAGEMVMGFE